MPTLPLETAGDRAVDLAASAIERAFESYHEEFKKLTRRARTRFERRQWREAQSDSVERLELYPRLIDRTVATLQALLGDGPGSAPTWRAIKSRYSGFIATREDMELAETFFNSTVRKMVGMVGVDPEATYVASDVERVPRRRGGSIFTTYARNGGMKTLITNLLRSCCFQTPYADLERDAGTVARGIDAHVLAEHGGGPIDAIDIVDPVFYRNKSAFIIGRIHCGRRTIPLILPLLHAERGIVVDSVLLSEDDASILFSFTRSYFHVEVEAPRQLILFLKSIMPLKRIAELYTSIGHNRHGKTELYRDLIHHLETSSDSFEIARGEKGMVMVVFTLPSYDVVFKVIRDEFPYPKTSVRRQVMEKYNLVFKHDRAGRLVDAQEFENWRFDRARFSGEVLEELRAHAAGSVTIEAGSVVISHLYTERRLTPLNLYLREAESKAAREAVLDYGRTVKDLAATNIFPGDLLLKNFGVTRHGRVVFYDYDELCLLTDCNFRAIPEASSPGEELQAEPWYFVGENDIFPEEFLSFLGLRGDLRDIFLAAHGDLLGAEFWLQMQERHRSGVILDVFAYKPSQRFGHERG